MMKTAILQVIQSLGKGIVSVQEPGVIILLSVILYGAFCFVKQRLKLKQRVKREV